MAIWNETGQIRVRYRIAFSLCAMATLATLLTLVLPQSRLAEDLERASLERLDRATGSAMLQLQDAQDRLLLRHRATARTPEFRANLETADVATLDALANSLLEREQRIDAVTFTNSRGGIVAQAGIPALRHYVSSLDWRKPIRLSSCGSASNSQDCREVTGEGDSVVFTSAGQLVIGSSVPLYIRGRFVGRISFYEIQPDSTFDKWSALAGAEINLSPSVAPLGPIERVLIEVPPLQLRVRGSFEAERHALARMQKTVFSAGLFALLIAFILSGPLSHSLLAPLQAIQAAAHRIRQGDRETRLRSVRQDEFGEVANAFDTMLDHLESVQAGLEQAQRVGRLGGWHLDVGESAAVVTRQLEFIMDLEADAGRVEMADIIQRIHPADRSAFEAALHRCEREGLTYAIDHRLVCSDGSERIVHSRAERGTQEDGRFRLEGTIQDITARKKTEEQIQALAYRDGLTGLGNRRFFAEDLQRALATSQQRLCPLAVIFLDIDNFKIVNDTLGHGIGDQLLCVIAESLCEVAAEFDENAGEVTVHRLGGDEFALILPQLADGSSVARCAETILSRLATTTQLEGYDVQVSASVGIATWPDEGQDVETLLKGCDTAMYHAKIQGRGQYHFYNASMQAASERRLRIEGGLRRAVEGDELEIVYQPKVAPASGAVVGFEALLRWNDRELGAVSPEEFIAVAEETGQIIALGEWVLTQVAGQAKAWFDAGAIEVPIAINVSSLQLESETFLDSVVNLLRDTDLPPHLLEFEVTESSLLQVEDRAIEILTDMKALGVKLSLDDFGTGYSSLSYLRRLPIDTVKIDRSFVESIAHDERDRAFVESIVSMSRVLGLDVIVEGVEDAAQRDILHAMGSIIIQGWFYSPGLPPNEVPQIIRDGFEAA